MHNLLPPHSKVVLKDKLSVHFVYLISFLIGNIVLELINCVLIKMIVFDKIENINIEKLNKMLKCKNAL